jgi:D-threonate/D-erythronate kinase
MNLKKNIETHKKQISNTGYNPGSGPVEDKIVVVADDFTGANDTGVQFSKRNLSSTVIINIKDISKSLNNCNVLIIDTESRFDNKEKAYKKSFETGTILKKEKIKYVYKKLDSTLRGNIGAEIAGLMDSMDFQYAVVAPAFPSNQRITKNGMVYIKGILLAETEISNDPRTPVKESFIPKIISQQTDKKIGTLDLNEVRAGEQNLIKKLQNLITGKIQIIVIDAQEESDLELIATVTASMKERVLFVGSPGFAEFLPKCLGLQKERKINVVLAGSVSEITRKQIDFVSEKLPVRVIDVDTEKLFSGEQLHEKLRIMAIVKESSQKGIDTIIRSAPSGDSVARSVILGQNYELKADDVSEIIASFLGEIGSEIIHTIKINGILMTGGETAIKTVLALKISGTNIINEIDPGIPFGHFIEEDYKNITVVTKAGSFGSEEAIYKVLTFLKKKSNNG